MAKALGGEFLMAFITAVAFATILAVVSGLVLAASSAFSHDVYRNILRRGQATEAQQMRVAQWSSVFVGLAAIILALGAQKLNVAFLVSLAFAVAASANLPVLLLTFFLEKIQHIRCHYRAVHRSDFFCTARRHRPERNGSFPRLDPCGRDFFSSENPGIVSIPLGFLGGVVGTWLSLKANPSDRFNRMLVMANLAVDEKNRQAE